MTAVGLGQLVTPLRRGVSIAPEEAGGKGAALDRMIQDGFPVPPTAIVTATAYRAIVADPTLGALLDRLVGGAETVPAEVVDDAFLAVPIPDAIAEAVTTVARDVGVGGPVAVRSSATVEDLAAASFAGQYRSSLDVDVDDSAALLRAVRLTWASLWHPAPCTYRKAWGIASDDIAMAVVIMRMVAAQMAGVVFTVDPAGEPDQLRVEAVPELGEALVSGARTPDVWLLPRDAPARVAAPPQVIEAATMALRVERTAGASQDVEWAWDGGRLWLVQARPITAGTAVRGDGCETPVDDCELTTAGIGEMLPGVIPPLLWDVNAFLVEEALREVLGQLWSLPARQHGPHEFIRRVNGQAALNLDLIKAAAASLPGSSEAELERQYFGVATAADAEAARPGRLRSMRYTLRAAAVRRRAAIEAEVVLAATAEITAAQPAMASRPAADLLAYRRRLIDLGARAMTVELTVAAAAVAAYQQLEAFLVPHLGERDAASAAQRVTTGAGAPRQATAAMSRAIFGGPTWEETSAELLPLDSSRRAQRDTARRELENRLSTNPRWRRTRILTGQVVDVRLRLLRRLVEDATAALVRREQVKAAVLAIGGLLRHVHLEIGRHLTATGVLDDPGDIDLLRDAELQRALQGDGPPPAELSRRRRWLRRCSADGPLPVRFVGVPAPTTAAMPAGDRFEGWAASPGHYTGRGRVVVDPVHDRFDAADVLVATATDAGWSPLFLRAGAIVVERGGPLSHAAIVARELGVPAVLNVSGATSVMDGRLVTVDGDSGVVTVPSANAREEGPQ